MKNILLVLTVAAIAVGTSSCVEMTGGHKTAEDSGHQNDFMNNGHHYFWVNGKSAHDDKNCPHPSCAAWRNNQHQN